MRAGLVDAGYFFAGTFYRSFLFFTLYAAVRSVNYFAGRLYKGSCPEIVFFTAAQFFYRAGRLFDRYLFYIFLKRLIGGIFNLVSGGVRRFFQADQAFGFSLLFHFRNLGSGRFFNAR